MGTRFAEGLETDTRRLVLIYERRGVVVTLRGLQCGRVGIWRSGRGTRRVPDGYSWSAVVTRLVRQGYRLARWW